jgi:AraC-like DNA-binding protein
MEQKQEQVYDNRVMRFTHWHCGDIILGHSVTTFKELTSFTGSNNNDVVRFHFGIKGDYRFYYKQLDRSFDLIGGHHNIMYSREFDIEVYNKTLELETFGIQFPRQQFIQITENGSDSLKRFAAAIMDGRNMLLSEHWGAIDSPIQQAIQQIMYCKYGGDLKTMFLLSKSVELLVLCAESYIAANSKTDAFLRSKADKEKIIAARDLINERVTNPPNLSEISKSIGLNEYKLKRGFKETFNNTVFGYLTEQRLHLAHQYLRDTQKTAAEISFELGYATPQHFNNAFKKKFGVTPFSVRNNP